MTRDAMRSPRFETLARICGLVDADHARGKMLRLWDQCTEEQTYVLPVDDVVSVLGENAIDGLERSRLGELVDGGVRIKGTAGRIEWLGDKRRQASAAGQARAEGAPRDAKGRLLPSSGSSGTPAVAGVAGPAASSEPPAAASPPITTPSLHRSPTPSLFEEPIRSGALDLRAPPVPARDVVAELWAEQERLRRAAKSSVHGLTLSTKARANIAALLKTGGFSEADLRASLASYGEEAARTRSVEFIDGVTNWRPDNVLRQLGRIGTSSRGRDGPGGARAAPLKGMSAMHAILERQAKEPSP